MGKFKYVLIGVSALILSLSTLFFGMRAAFPRRYGAAAEQSAIEPALAYAVMKAESGFNEHAKSKAGAIGLMQLKPSTAEFVCMRSNLVFEPHRLEEGAYNALLGCRYLQYLTEKFSVLETVIAAYNAGEGTVSKWLEEKEYSDDGQKLNKIPYEETRRYVKKVFRYCKVYRILY
ncbi:MAG: lytic transglycosylase domain-containing protein [Clostridia bacterium]|jgi:soluble lytic murein transglycosylase|nr:lytic transglycosylase domain-containing protein [Clostridia bacterium]